MSDAYSGVGPDYDLVPIDHDPFGDVGASMARHLTGNPAAGPGPNPAQAVLDWRNSGQSWADQYHDYAQRAAGQDTQGAIQAAGNPMDLFGGFVGSTAPEAGAPKGITAYHGSPYDFNRFDISKIGTGEGAQAYGHGLYMAENPATAESYKTSAPVVQWQGQTLPFESAAQKLSESLEGQQPYTTAELITKWISQGQTSEQIEKRIRQGGWDSSTKDQLRAANEAAKDNLSRAPGKMYQVSIAADPEHFLDWDKPLSEQPHIPGHVVDKVADMLDRDPRGITGGDLVHTLSRNADQFAATEQLRQAGIPGIKYLDQGSRGSGAGTHNYVVFSDDIIQILRKYGMAGLIAGGGSHFSLSPVEQKPDFGGMARGGRVGRKARVAAILQRHGIAA